MLRNLNTILLIAGINQSLYASGWIRPEQGLIGLCKPLGTYPRCLSFARASVLQPDFLDSKSLLPFDNCCNYEELTMLLFAANNYPFV